MIAAWRARSACRGQGPSAFFPATASAEDEAKAICRVCPVRMECLWLAIDERLEGGIFGGANQDERDRAARRLTRRIAPRKPTVRGRRAS